MNCSHIHCDRAFFARNPAAKDFLNLFEFLPSVIFYAKDRKGRIVAANTALLEAQAWAGPEELFGKTVFDFHPPLLAQAYHEEDLYVMGRNAPLANRVWFVLDRSGRSGWFSSSKVPLHGDRGRVIGLAGVRYAISTPADAERQFRELAGVIKILETRHREPLSMKELADASGLSSTHFNRRFAELIGVSPTRLLHSIRIDHARHLLARTDQTISDIAIEVGYYDQSHLTRHFRRQCGITPRAYRQRFRS